MTPDPAAGRGEGIFFRVPFHVVLLPVCFILASFAGDRYEVEIGSVIQTMLALVLGVVLLMALLRPLFLTWRRAAVATSSTTFYMLYEPSLLFSVEPGNGFSLAIFGIATLALLLVLVRLWRSHARLATLTMALNVIGLVAPLPDLWVLANWYAGNPGPVVAPAGVFPDLPLPPSEIADGTEHPDIWYLVPDRYANAANIQSRYGYDNSAFINMLRARGFTIIDNAHANYQRTAVSMASVLNLDYLDAFRRFPDIDGHDWLPLYHALTDNRVSRFLDRAGYRIHRFGSHWEPTRRDPHADEHHNVFDMPEFTQRVMSVTVPGQLAHATGLGAIDGWYSHCQRIQRQFDGLVALAGRNEQKYVMAHLLVTHPPFALAQDGRCLSYLEAAVRPAGQEYVDSVRYANSRLGDLIDAILKAPRPAIIVLMSDEGPWPPGISLMNPGGIASSKMIDWSGMTAAQLDLKTGILMAIRLPQGTPPDAAAGGAFPNSPVNVFRMIFRRSFGLDLPPLPDRYYIYRSDEAVYDFIDVTDLLPR